MKNRLYIAVASMLCWAATHARPAAAQNSDAITITPDDFRVDKTELLEQLADLESMARLTTASADYAEAYERFHASLGRARVAVSNWQSDERDRLRALPAPPEEAWQALDDYRADVRRRNDARTEAVTAEAARRSQQRAEEDRLARQREQATQDAERARESAQQQMELWRDALRGNSWYYYPGAWGGGWHGHHGSGGHGGHHHRPPRRSPQQVNPRPLYGAPGSYNRNI